MDPRHDSARPPGLDALRGAAASGPGDARSAGRAGRGDGPGEILLVGGCGYVGSYLCSRLRAQGRLVTVCDRGDRGPAPDAAVLAVDYDTLDAGFLARFRTVLLFAGHSSVARAVQDPQGALANNCLNLIAFARRLAPGTRFVYASTGSLYSTRDLGGAPSGECHLPGIPSHNAYDISKFAFDYLAEHFLGDFHALRLGTVSGWSPRLREELVFNAMNLSAVREGVVRLRNHSARRTLLFLDDLGCLVDRLLDGGASPGVCNAGSWSGRMGDLAREIAAVWGAEVVDEGDSPTYSFTLDTGRMRALCGSLLVPADLPARCRAFVAACERAGLPAGRTRATSS